MVSIRTAGLPTSVASPVRLKTSNFTVVGRRCAFRRAVSGAFQDFVFWGVGGGGETDDDIAGVALDKAKRLRAQLVCLEFTIGTTLEEVATPKLIMCVI